jgi:hypothetical protein
MQVNQNKGVTVEHDLKGAAFAQVTMIYKGRYVPANLNLKHLEVEVEIYKAENILSAHIVCPKCRHGSWIDGRNKKVEYDKSRGLFIEAFTCPWEMGDENDHTEFGIGLCQFKCEYAGKIIREA